MTGRRQEAPSARPGGNAGLLTAEATEPSRSTSPTSTQETTALGQNERALFVAQRAEIEAPSKAQGPRLQQPAPESKDTAARREGQHRRSRRHHYDLNKALEENARVRQAARQSAACQPGRHRGQLRGTCRDTASQRHSGHRQGDHQGEAQPAAVQSASAERAADFDLGGSAEVFGGSSRTAALRRSAVPSIVGERGPEIFVPKTAGTIIPNGAMGGTAVIDAQTFILNPGGYRKTVGAAIRSLASSISSRTLGQRHAGVPGTAKRRPGIQPTWARGSRMTAIAMPASPGFTPAGSAWRPTPRRSPARSPRPSSASLLGGCPVDADLHPPADEPRQAAAWQAFFLQLEGGANTFYAYDPDAKTRAGSPPARRWSRAAARPAARLTIDGCTANVTGWLKAGDYFAVNGELKMLTADANTNGSGEATLQLQARPAQQPRRQRRRSPSPSRPARWSWSTTCRPCGSRDHDRASTSRKTFSAIEVFS